VETGQPEGDIQQAVPNADQIPVHDYRPVFDETQVVAPNIQVQNVVACHRGVGFGG
jgi:hypothetical protein